MDFGEISQQLVNALSLGATYALLALGLAVVYNMLGFVNFAHGELLTLGAFGLLIAERAGIPWALAAPIGLAVAVAAGVLMDKVAFKPVRGARGSTLLLTSFALSIVIQTVLMATITARPEAVSSPDVLTESVGFAGASISVLGLCTIAISAVVFGGLTVFFKRTSIGISIRASAEDFMMARMLGIKADRVVMVAFGISGFLAGIASLIWVATSGTVEPDMGLIPMLKAFIAAVLGGLGSLSGAAFGGFLLGAIEVILQLILPPDILPYVDAVAISAVVMILLLRPSGLFARRAT